MVNRRHDMDRTPWQEKANTGNINMAYVPL
jgi:hypothetical protein